MQARLSTVSHNGIKNYADRHHVNVTALLEALGEALANDLEVIDPIVAQRAGDIQAERNQRYPD